MLYIISKEGGIFDEDRKKLLEHARLPRDLREAINNLTTLGIKVTKMQRKAGEKSLRKKKERRRPNKDQEQPYELSRYVNTIKKVMEVIGWGQIEGRIGGSLGCDVQVCWVPLFTLRCMTGKCYRHHGCRTISVYPAIRCRNA
jgi:hypothetical protein